MSKTISYEGVVVARARSGKGLAFNIDGEDVWFNAQSEDQIPEGATKGALVAFEYSTSRKGTRTFNNIEGDVEVVEEADSKPSRGGGGGGKPYNRSGGSSSNAGYRKAPAGGGDKPSKDEWDAKDRRIVRQNALSQANALLRTQLEFSPQEAAEPTPEALIAIARIFEEYVYE